MTSPLLRLASQIPDSTYNSPEVRHWIEDQLETLRKDPNGRLIILEDYQRYRFEGDFQQLLIDLKVDPSLHYTALRMNGYINPQEYKGEVDHILLPSEEAVNRIHRLFKTYVSRRK